MRNDGQTVEWYEEFPNKLRPFFACKHLKKRERERERVSEECTVLETEKRKGGLLIFLFLGLSKIVHYKYFNSVMGKWFHFCNMINIFCSFGCHCKCSLFGPFYISDQFLLW